MTVAAETMDQYQGQKVIARVTPENGEGDVESLEGKAEVANESGLLLKVKGRSGLQLIALDRVEALEFAPETPKKIATKTVKVIGYGKVRQHLADRHGWTVSDLEEVSEEDALNTHQGLDHKVEGIAHVHGDKKASESDDDSE